MTQLKIGTLENMEENEIATLVLIIKYGSFIDGALEVPWALPEGKIATLSAAMNLNKLGLVNTEQGTLFTYFRANEKGEALIKQWIAQLEK